MRSEEIERGRPLRILRHGGFLCVALALVAWIRLIPQSLPSAEEAATGLVRARIGAAAKPPERAGLDPRERAALTQCEIDRWIERNRERFDQDVADTARQLRSDLRYEAPNGREYTYLGDMDSYLWLRRARTYLQQGTTCDEVVGGVCRDSFTLAPVGRSMLYARSLHIAAIAALQRVLDVLDPGHPLPATAALVPTLVALLGVFPAFGIGRRAAGPVGGLAAAVLVLCNPFVLRRTVGSDNDIWNVVLPLFAAWAATVSVASRRAPQQAACGVLAAGIVALQATTWSGWGFFYLVWFTALLANVAAQAIRLLWRGTDAAAALRRAGLVFSVFYLAASLSTYLVGAGTSALTAPWQQLVEQLSSVAHAMGPGGESIPVWKETFSSVREMGISTSELVARDLGGPLPFFVSWLGVLLLLLPRRRWTAGHFVVLLLGAVFFRYLFEHPPENPSALARLIVLPLTAATLLYARDRHDRDRASAWILIVWFLGGLAGARAGERFILLVAPAFAIANAVVIGRLHGWLDHSCLAWHGWRRSVGRIGALAAAAACLALPLGQSHAAASLILPRMTDAWWDTLIHLRDETPPDSIVTSWWDYGHWIAYAAQRRTTADGSALDTRVPQWIAKALTASDEEESAGILRMLNCGSDAGGQSPEAMGAYGRLIAAGLDDASAAEAILRLAAAPLPETAEIFDRYDVPSAARPDVLQATHCTPPPSVLVLSNAMVGLYPLWQLGNWNPERVHIARVARSQPQQEAMADFAHRYGDGEATARLRYQKARDLAPGAELNAYLAPPGSFLTQDWLPCDDGESNVVTCEIPGPQGSSGTVLTRFRFQADDPTRSSIELSGGQLGRPALLVVAHADELEKIRFPSPLLPHFGMLFDPSRRRLLIAAPHLIESTFTHLFFLDGRYLSRFRKFDERSAAGERVVAWKIDW